MNNVESTVSHDDPKFTHGQVRSVIIGVLLAILMGALNQAIVSVALPVLGA